MGSSLRRRSALGLAAVAASAAMTGMVRAQNLVSDPSFETSGPAGSFAAGGWTVTTNPNLSGPALRTPGTAGWPVHTGSWAAAYGDPLTAFGQTIEDTLSQSIATVPGTAYTVSFWLDNFGDKPGSTPSGQGFAANFAGGSITTNAVLTAYTQYSFTGTATATATTLNLAGFDYVNAGYYMLDDVSVTPQVTPAGPSTWVNTGSGDWNVATNWTPGIPNGIGAEADFLGAITTTSLVTTSQAETLGTVRFNNSNIYALNGTGSLTLQTSTGSALIDVQAGSHIIGLPLTLASNATFQTDGPATRLILSGPVTLAPGVKVAAAGAGTVTYTSSVTLGSAAAISFATPTAVTALTLGAAATATVSPTTGTRTYLQTSSLSLAATATLDVADNDLVVHGGSLAAVTAAVAAGYAGGLVDRPRHHQLDRRRRRQAPDRRRRRSSRPRRRRSTASRSPRPTSWSSTPTTATPTSTASSTGPTTPGSTPASSATGR